MARARVTIPNCPICGKRHTKYSPIMNFGASAIDFKDPQTGQTAGIVGLTVLLVCPDNPNGYFIGKKSTTTAQGSVTINYSFFTLENHYKAYPQHQDIIEAITAERGAE